MWEVHKSKNFRAPSACHKDAGASLRFILTTEMPRRLANHNTTSQPQRVHGTRLHLLCFGSSSGRALIAKSSMKQDAALCVFAACSISLLSNNSNLVRQLSRSQTVSLPKPYCFNTVVSLCLSNVLCCGTGERCCSLNGNSVQEDPVQRCFASLCVLSPLCSHHITCNASKKCQAHGFSSTSITFCGTSVTN